MDAESGFFKLRPDELKLIFEQLEPKSVANLCNSSSTLRDFCNRYNIWQKVSGAFDILDGNTLALTQVYSEPYQVVAFCNLNPGFRRNCNKPGFWPAMLRAHYPDVQIANNTTEAARQAYLENTTITFLVDVDVFGDNPGLTNSEGVRFDAMEYYGDIQTDDPVLDATLVPNGDWNDEGTLGLKMMAIYWDYDEVWVSSTSDYQGISLSAFANRHEAILDLVNSFDFNSSGLMNTGIDITSEEDGLDIVRVPSGPDYNEMYFNLYAERDLGDGFVELTLVNQRTWDRLHDSGYPQFVAGETVAQAKQRIYDYIELNRFFMWGVDFGGDIVNTEYTEIMQVFKVRLIKTIDPELELDQF